MEGGGGMVPVGAETNGKKETKVIENQMIRRCDRSLHSGM
jgi:hypothetical protein